MCIYIVNTIMHTYDEKNTIHIVFKIQSVNNEKCLVCTKYYSKKCYLFSKRFTWIFIIIY